jgi:TonB family protein
MRKELVLFTFLLATLGFASLASSSSEPVSKVELLAFLAGRVPNKHVATLVQQRGIAFAPTEEYIQDLKLLGYGNEVLEAVRSAKVLPIPSGAPSSVAKETAVLEHLTRGIQLRTASRFSEVEKEFRDAVQTDPVSPLLHYDLALAMPTDTDAELESVQTQLREAIRLEPDFGEAHSRLALTLRGKGDIKGAVAEYREAVRVEPDNFIAHTGLASALTDIGDPSGAIAEYRAAVAVLPEFAGGHAKLASALEASGDLHAAANEFRECIRLKPDFPGFRTDLARTLDKLGDHQEAQEQLQIVQRLNAALPTPSRIRLGGNTMRDRLIKQTNPSYPSEARRDRVQGVVRLELIVGDDGAVKECKAIEGPANLVESAITAVRQWRWKPVLLNGKPVEVVTEVDINFSLSE